METESIFREDGGLAINNYCWIRNGRIVRYDPEDIEERYNKVRCLSNKSFLNNQHGQYKPQVRPFLEVTGYLDVLPPNTHNEEAYWRGKDDESPIPTKAALARSATKRSTLKKVPPNTIHGQMMKYLKSIHGGPKMMHSLKSMRSSASKKKEKISSGHGSQRSISSRSRSPSPDTHESGIWSTASSNRDSESNANSSRGRKGKKTESSFESKPKLARTNSVDRKPHDLTVDTNKNEKGKSSVIRIDYNPSSGVTFRENRTSDVQVVVNGYNEEPNETKPIIMGANGRRRRVQPKGPHLSPLGVASVNSHGALDWDDDKMPTSDGICVIGKDPTVKDLENSHDEAIGVHRRKTINKCGIIGWNGEERSSIFSGISYIRKSFNPLDIPFTMANERYKIPQTTNPGDSVEDSARKLKKRLSCCAITSSNRDNLGVEFVGRQAVQHLMYRRKQVWHINFVQASEEWNMNCKGKSRPIQDSLNEICHESLVTRDGILVHLDDNKSDNSTLMTLCNCQETKHNQLYGMLFGKTMHQQRNSNEYVSELKKIMNEERMIRSNLLLYFQKIGYEAHQQRQFHPGMHAGCDKGNWDELFLHLDDKRKEFKKCFSNADLPKNENHILLEKVAMITRYCDQMFAFVTVTHARLYSDDQKLWLEMLTEDLINTAYKRIFHLLQTSDVNNGLCRELLTVVNDNDKFCGVSVKIGDGALGEKFSKQQFIECQMCIDQNNALYWCKNCRMNICSFCKMYHETVWTVMNHEVYPLLILS